MYHVKPNKDNIVVKQFKTRAHYGLEIDGYNFIQQYYTKIPRRFRTNSKKLKIEYEDVGKNCTTLSEALDKNLTIDMSKTWQELALLANKRWSHTHAQGGTQLFYIDRLSRINDAKLALLTNYQLPKLDNYEAKIKPTFFTDLGKKIQELQYGICIPSQGDLHERNIFTNGVIVDFEGAGFNNIATDIATFVWHTIFAGSYFGPQYAKWATTKTSKKITVEPKCFSIFGNTIKVNIDIKRQELILQFIYQYINRLNLADQDKYLDQVCLAIAFRILTTFQLSTMSEEDQKMSLVFAHLFANTQFSLWEKLRFFLDSSEDLKTPL